MSRSHGHGGRVGEAGTVYLIHLDTSYKPARRSAPEQRLEQRLTDHAPGRDARLTQVQIERGGSWVLAQTQPGGRTTERRLKQHGASRRCGVCKAAGGFRSGELTAQQALARAGWNRSNPVQRPVLPEISGLPQPPTTTAEQAAAPKPAVPAPRPAPRPAPALEIDALADALIEGWSPHADPQPETETEPEPEAAR